MLPVTNMDSSSENLVTQSICNSLDRLRQVDAIVLISAKLWTLLTKNVGFGH